jgi:hypothetical protein
VPSPLVGGDGVWAASTSSRRRRAVSLGSWSARRRHATVTSHPWGFAGHALHRPLGGSGHQRLPDGVLAGVKVAVAPRQRTEHLRDQPPDGPPVGHGSTLASCMSGRTSTPQYLAAGLRAAISKARSRLSQSTIVKLPRYSLASA